MELREMRVAVTIAESGSVSGAADVLHLSPSSVSQALAKLENELGTSLFHRLPRGMACTAAGEAFVVAARRTLHAAEGASQAVSAVDGLLAGQVDLVTVNGFVGPVDRLLTRFTQLHPGVVPVLHAPRASASVVSMVRTGRSEIGVVLASDVPPGMQGVPIGDDETMVVVPTSHPFAERATVRVADLEHEPLVLPSSGRASRAAISALFVRLGIEPRVVAEVDDPRVTLGLVTSGVGLTILPAAAVQSWMADEVAVVGLDPPLARELCLLTREEPLSPAAAALVEVATGLLPSEEERPVRSV